MRAAVVGAATLMAAAIAGIGVFAYSAFTGGSGSKARGARVHAPGGATSSGNRGTSGEARGPGEAARPAWSAHAGEAPGDSPAAPKTRVPANHEDGDPAGEGEANGGSTVRGVPGGSGASPGSTGSLGAAADPAVPFFPGAVGAGAPGAPAASSPSRGVAALGGVVRLDAASACPTGMVDVGSFCIDATEVTNASYASFLEAPPNRRVQPSSCQWNIDYMPTGGPPPADNRPVVGVDWCDAWLYCAWSGKRLCGKTGGGNNPPGYFADATRSEWHNVCTNGGTTPVAYGDMFDGTKCAHPGNDGTLAPVSAVGSCVGAKRPYDQVFDMSGNAWEWEDSCTGTSGEKDLCRVRGSASHTAAGDVTCAMDYLGRREQALKTVGIRCCADRRP